MIYNIKTCPFCGGTTAYHDSKDFRGIVCLNDNCGATVYFVGKDYKDDIINAYEYRGKLEEKPLTIEQLKEMNNQEVFACGKVDKLMTDWDKYNTHSVKIDSLREAVRGDYENHKFSEYGEKWIAYSKKLEVEE